VEYSKTIVGHISINDKYIFYQLDILLNICGSALSSHEFQIVNISYLIKLILLEWMLRSLQKYLQATLSVWVCHRQSVPGKKLFNTTKRVTVKTMIRCASRTSAGTFQRRVVGLLYNSYDFTMCLLYGITVNHFNFACWNCRKSGPGIILRNDESAIRVSRELVSQNRKWGLVLYLF